MPDADAGRREFAIRVSSIDALFSEFDPRPMAERTLAEDVRLFLLDQWDLVRLERPTALTIYAPESERATTDAAAVKTALHSNIEAFTGSYRHAVPMSRRQRVTALVGTVAFLVSIAVSSVLERLTDDFLVTGLSQGIVLVGWVALWAPAQYVVVDAIPHRRMRSRYAEFADLDVRLVWEPTP